MDTRINVHTMHQLQTMITSSIAFFCNAKRRSNTNFSMPSGNLSSLLSDTSKVSKLRNGERSGKLHSEFEAKLRCCSCGSVMKQEEGILVNLVFASSSTRRWGESLAWGKASKLK